MPRQFRKAHIETDTDPQGNEVLSICLDGLPVAYAVDLLAADTVAALLNKALEAADAD